MDYLALLTPAYTAAANASNAAAMKLYLRNQFEHLGIKTPDRRAINKALKAQYGLPSAIDMPALIKALWERPEREYQYAAIDLMQQLHKEWTSGDIHLFEYMITHKSWWDSVDGTISCLAGPWLKKFPAAQPAVTDKWINSDQVWLQRAAIIFQNAYKKDTNEELMYRYINQCAHSKEFFIQKAIGWALREYSKTNPGSVRAFVDSHTLAPLSKREALKRMG